MEKSASTARPDRIQQLPTQPVFVFSGMGQQWWAMGRELLAEEPVFRRAVDEVCELFAAHSGWSLMEKLTADEAHSQLRETRYGQPAIFALQVGLAALWRSWGVEPAAVLGHSAGEMAATYVSGALSLEDAVRVTFHRSRLQYRAAGQGIMVAAGISEEEAARLVARHPRAISIAAINAAGSVTLSGDAAVLGEIETTINAAGGFCRTLQVDVPYHSPKMEPLEQELLETLRDIRPRSTDAVLFHRDRHGDVGQRGRCAVLVSQRARPRAFSDGRWAAPSRPVTACSWRSARILCFGATSPLPEEQAVQR